MSNLVCLNSVHSSIIYGCIVIVTSVYTFHIHTHALWIYKKIYMNQPIWSMFVSGGPVHIKIFCFFPFPCLSCGRMLSYGHLKCKLHVLACELSWGLNVDHWLVAVEVSLLTVLYHSALAALTLPSCTTRVFDQV